MTSRNGSFTVTDLVAAASKVLEDGKYNRVTEDVIGSWPTPNARVFEDDYGIVALVVYETWVELLDGWIDAQAALVELMSAHLTRSNAKSWDGYLIVLTPSVSGADGRVDRTKIQYDTGRVRKIVGTGEELGTLGDVERLLFPILSLEEFNEVSIDSALDMLPGVLSQHGIPEVLTETAIQAFHDHQSIVESIHSLRGNT